jgi:hypothetical protein
MKSAAPNTMNTEEFRDNDEEKVILVEDLQYVLKTLESVKGTDEDSMNKEQYKHGSEDLKKCTGFVNTSSFSGGGGVGYLHIRRTMSRGNEYHMR